MNENKEIVFKFGGMTKIGPESIGVGSRLPEVELKTFDPAELGKKDVSGLTPKSINTKDFFAGKTVAVFTITGAFTPVCTNKQLPGFVQNVEKLKEKGVDEVVCIAVNDIFTLAAFAKHTNCSDKIRFLADGNAVFARQAQLFEDLTDKALGYRIKRCAMLVKDGEVQYIGIDPSGEKESSVNAVLSKLEEKQE